MKRYNISMLTLSCIMVVFSSVLLITDYKSVTPYLLLSFWVLSTLYFIKEINKNKEINKSNDIKTLNESIYKTFEVFTVDEIKALTTKMEKLVKVENRLREEGNNQIEYNKILYLMRGASESEIDVAEKESLKAIEDYITMNKSIYNKLLKIKDAITND